MDAANTRRVIGAIVVAVAVVVSAACSSSKDAATTDSGATSASNTALTATARGVTADAIRIGYSYPDLESLAKTGVIKVSFGPVEPVLSALVDDINKHGGINGRKLELSFGKFPVLGNEGQLAACTKLTEDDEVFAILGGFIADNNLCAIQQHATMVIFNYGAGFNQIVLQKAQAPFITPEASDERSTEALVRILDEQGRLKGKTIGVYGTLSASKPLIDLTVKDLEALGYKVKDTAINDVPATDTQAFSSQDKILGRRFQDEGIDTVIVQVTVPPGTNFDSIGYHPTFFSPQMSLVSSGSFTNGYEKFPLVAGLGATGDPNGGYDSPEMRRCRAVWKAASGHDVDPPPVEVQKGKSSGYAALSGGCTTLQIFVAAAKAAGPNLTYDTFMKSLEALGPIALASTPKASFGSNKPDGQDSFQLVQLNPQWTPNSAVRQFLPLGDPITLKS